MQATSIRQSAKWGMRMFQGSLPRMKDIFGYKEKGERNLMVLLTVLLFKLRRKLLVLIRFRNFYTVSITLDAILYSKCIPFLVRVIFDKHILFLLLCMLSKHNHHHHLHHPLMTAFFISPFFFSPLLIFFSTLLVLHHHYLHDKHLTVVACGCMKGTTINERTRRGVSF